MLKKIQKENFKGEKKLKFDTFNNEIVKKKTKYFFFIK